MNAVAPSVAAGSTERERFPWMFAAIRGLVAFAIVAAVAQVPAILSELFGAGMAPSTTLKLGWLYALTFHRIGIDVSGGSFDYRLSVALLSGTAFAVWVLYREGRRIAARVDGGRVRAALAGATLAPTYAAAFLVVTWAMHLDLVGLPLVVGPVRIGGVTPQAFLFPLVLAAGAGSIGGLLPALPGRSVARAALTGGWRMLLAALGGSIVALLLVAAARPAGLGTYARVVGGHGPKLAAYLLGHQALALPNIALGVLVASMGGCVSLHGSGFAAPVVCFGRLPRLETSDLVRTFGDAVAGARPPALSRPMPVGYASLILVPLIATIWGGRRSTAPFDERSARIAAAAWSGAVFGSLVGIGSWLASVTITLESSVSLGPRPLGTWLLALAWGVGGGALGAAFPRRQTPVPEPGLAAEPPEPEPVPPSPTSV